MKNSISKKISRITFGLILLVLCITFCYQTIFFEDFYLKKKTESLLLNVKRFKTMYSYQIYNNNTLADALKDYEEKNNSRIAIFSQNGELKYLSNYNESIEDINTLTSFCKDLLSDKDLINEVVSDDKVKSTIFSTSNANNKKIGIVAPMSLQRKNDSILISVSSIQPITEASTVIKSFYLYFLVGFIIVALLLSKIYSKLISKPLININNIAKKMSLLDFDAKCEETSDDEIGNLAKTLNFLSSNLKKSLDDLKEKNNQLEQDIEKERTLEKMRKDFVASVSHDLKTPLGIIRGYAEGLKDGIVTGEQSIIYINTIIEETEKMDLLLKNMLQLSQLESETISTSIESFNIIRLLRSMINKFSLEASSKNLKIELIAPMEYSYVKADVLKIEQVIQNLLSNAIKYTPPSNKIIVSVKDDNEYYSISIENKNAHIPENEIDNIFLKFYRLDKSGDRSKNSFGLGLSIVKRILELHNSDFSLINTSDGVLFTFTLIKDKIID